MKFPLSWLSEFIDTQTTPTQIAKMLTNSGIEVESMHSFATSFTGVVVGLVVRAEKHPNADKLSVATVSDGSQEYQVVCGAPNCRPGLKTAFAREGAKLKDASGSVFSIKRTKLRGVESCGMLCSSRELQLGEDAEGIIEFDNRLKEGTDLQTLYADTLFEVGLTPNLGHCSSIIGIARELSALTKKQICYPKFAIEENGSSIKEAIKVTVQDFKAVPRYTCRVITGVKIAPSPEWMQKKLTAAGIRPVNNVVDSANFVVLEMGQPIHTFDLDQLQGRVLTIRTATENERIVTLDDKERLLANGDIVICDKNRPVAIAGIMGGLNTEISEQTQNILIEVALFNPTHIRRTRKQMGLLTDAARRFERGVDPNNLLNALDRVTALIHQLAGGSVAKGVIDLHDSTIQHKKVDEKQIQCRLSRINGLIGIQLSVSEVEAILNSLEMRTSWDGKDSFLVSIPTYRIDIAQEVDIIEEVARIYGYDNIAKKASSYSTSRLPNSPLFDFERVVRDRLLTEGLQEFLTCSLIGPTLLNIIQNEQWLPEALIQVLNPTSIEQSILRPSLLPGILQLVKYNQDHQNHNASGFEIGRIYFKEGDQYKEQLVVGIGLYGQNHPDHWDKKSSEVDFYELKGILENLLGELKISPVTFKNSSFSTLHPGRQATVMCGDVELGSFGEIHPSICRRLGVTQRIYFAELNLHDLMQVLPTGLKMEELPLYPSSERDWTITVDEDVQIDNLIQAIHAINSSLLEEVTIKDLFRSDKLGQNKKNITLHFVYRDRDRTVEQEVVEAEHARITSAVLKSLEKR